MRRAGKVALDAALGSAAGALASLFMTRVTTFMYERQDERATRAEQTARGGKQSFEVAAEKIARLGGVQLGREQAQKAGKGLSWALALGMGAVYGVVRRRVPAAHLGGGFLFGALFWLAVDEVMNAAFRFTPGPRAFPWQAHARGLAGHLAYGVAADLQLRAAQSALR